MSDEDVIVMIDEEGTEVRFLHIMTFDFENSFYVALTPEETVDGIENGEVLLMEIIEDEDGEETYAPIEDEAKLDRVWEEFERLYYEDEDGEDEHEHGPGCGCEKE
jgi:uncharacterized protein YrzB (UPF0473 family)